MFEKHLADATDGTLWLDPSGAIKGRDAAEEWVSALSGLRATARDIPRSKGFSDLPSATQLAGKFDRLAGDEVLIGRLNDFIEAGQELSDLFLLSIQKFEDTDESAARYLQEHRLDRASIAARAPR
ncbi:hypothetical protein [Smaragdicoccus niigatensis]|uniref:hypothetical protein n=1 Tax=Smaragdicoccus niigatensis TaxID=359359 RepID=UPI000367D897|nr:hypothetical protein [Smaragdicoccus niigatensis]